MNFLKRYKNVILFTIIAILVIGGYFFFFTGGETEGDSTVSSETVGKGAKAAPAAESKGGEILPLLLEMRSIDLKKDIFESSVFNSLESFSQQIRSQPKGRENPFSPFGKQNEPEAQKEKTEQPQPSGE